jgi:hypothetical protein
MIWSNDLLSTLTTATEIHQFIILHRTEQLAKQKLTPPRCTSIIISKSYVCGVSVTAASQVHASAMLLLLTVGNVRRSGDLQWCNADTKIRENRFTLKVKC